MFFEKPLRMDFFLLFLKVYAFDVAAYNRLSFFLGKKSYLADFDFFFVELFFEKPFRMDYSAFLKSLHSMFAIQSMILFFLKKLFSRLFFVCEEMFFWEPLLSMIANDFVHGSYKSTGRWSIFRFSN